MRKSFYALLVLFSCASLFAQTLKSPVNNSSVSGTKPTFKWSKSTAAVSGYQFCLLVTGADSSNALLPLSADVNKWKRYVNVGTTSSDTSFTIDSVLARSTAVRAWKVRARLSPTTFGTWIYQSGKFTIGIPVTSISTADAVIKIDHDIYSAVRQLTYVKGSNKQILDTTYNDANKFGLGGNGSRDTLVSWYNNSSDTAIFTYQNTGKYGKTGTKAITIVYGATGVTADVVTTLETGKNVTLSAAWKPGGVLDTTDNVVMVDNLAATRAVYPAAVATTPGSDSIMVRAMYDANYLKEYFGFKSSSVVAVADTQKTGQIKQAYKFTNASGSNKAYTLSFAVRQTRAEFFDAWANNRLIFVTKPAVGDSVLPGMNYVSWESFGAKPDTIKYSSDGGTTFASTAVISKDTTVVDSVQYRLPNGVLRNTSMLKLISTKSDVGLSGVFIARARTLAVTSPVVTDSLKPDSAYVVWTNNTPVAVTAVEVSVDSGKTYAAALPVSSTNAVDSLLVYFNGKTSNAYVRVSTGSLDTALSARFTLLRYITIVSPKSGDVITPGQSYIVWNNYTGVALTKLNMSLDSGKTYIGDLTNTSTKTVDSVQYTFNGTKSSATECFVQAYTGSGDIGKSGKFTIGGGGATFSIPKLFGDPAGIVDVPVNFVDGVAGDSLKAFDVNLTFDSTYVKFNSITYNASMNNWVKLMDSTNALGTNFVRVSAFKNSTGAGIKDAELFKLRFTIKNKQSLIGGSTTLTIKNGVLSAAGKDALALNVSSSSNGILKIYSSIAGNINYFHGKWDGSSSYTVSGDSLINYYDSSDVANNSVFSVTNGYFKMSNRVPNDTINFYPAASKYMAAGVTNIDVVDASLAFRDWHDTLQVRARIAADVNGDGLVNTTDAMAIMEISVDSTYLTRVGQTNWLFIDSTSLASFESASDSLTGWYAKQKHSISYTIVAQRDTQNFFGVLRGDVDFSHGASAAVSTLKKASAAPVMISTDATIKARPGDVVWIPMNIMLNGENVGGFNTSMQLDPKIFTYAGEFKMGATIPQNKNWYVTAKADAGGMLRVAGTDFSLDVNPITQDGPAILFKYVVNKDTKRGTTSQISVNAQTVVDNKMAKIASSVKGGSVEISRMGATVVTDYALSQNYPNPFNPSTTIEFAVPMDSKVDIRIYNVIGQQVATLFSGVQTVGFHQVDFNASQLGSGIYFYVIKAEALAGGKNFTAVKKMMLLK